MRAYSITRSVVLSALVIVGVTSSAAADAGIKFGPTFARFGTDNLDFDTRTGLHGGIFFGGNRSGVVGLQSEINWIRKNAEYGIEGQDIRVDYLQVPVLLRLNAGSDSFVAYGIAGPAFNFKIADEVEGITLDDGFEGFDMGLVFGGGIEISRIIIEGRYEKGFRRINNLFEDFLEIKSQSFTILFGVRFN